MRFGIIGIGSIGPINVRALMAMPEVEIVAVANRTVATAKKLCASFGLTCTVYDQWSDMLREVQPEAVLIELYNDLHYEAFLECARLGIHILVEKPMANHYEDCLEMIRAANASGIRATVMQTQRYGSVLQTAKVYITEHREELGELLCVNDQMGCHYFYDARPVWHLDPVRSGGGIVMNYGVHQLDRIHWLMEQKTVNLQAVYLTKKPDIHTCSSYVMMGQGDRGTPYTATCNGYSGPWINDITLSFAKGIVRCQVMDALPMEKGVYVGNAATNKLEKIPFCCIDGENNHEMYCREMRAAMDYLMGYTDTPPVSLEWGAEMVRLCEQGFQK